MSLINLLWFIGGIALGYVVARFLNIKISEEGKKFLEERRAK